MLESTTLMNLPQIKNFCLSKDTIKEVKKQATILEKMYVAKSVVVLKRVTTFERNLVFIGTLTVHFPKCHLHEIYELECSFPPSPCYLG